MVTYTGRYSSGHLIPNMTELGIKRPQEYLPV